MSMKNLPLVCAPFDLSKSDESPTVTMPRILASGFFNPAYLQPAETAPRATASAGTRGGITRHATGSSQAVVRLY